MSNNKILFYKTGDLYGAFSNFAKYPIIVNAKLYPTCEHYFQSKKFENTEYEELIIKAKTAKECATLGRNKSYPLRSDWETVKEDVMLTALKAKFTQHEELTKLLLSTEDKELVEHTTKDSYWADGGGGTGKNRLGILLMELRNNLKNVRS